MTGHRPDMKRPHEAVPEPLALSGEDAAAGNKLARAVPGEETVKPVYVWDLVVRSTHWLIVLSLIVLSVTGIYIGRPFLVSDDSSSLMGWSRVAHFYGAIVFSLAVASRILWMFVGGRYASWRELVPVTRQRWVDMWGTFRFYIFLDRKPPPALGHNPLAGASYIVVFSIYLMMIATGFALYSLSAYTSYMGWWAWLVPIFGGPQTARWLHHVGMWLLIGFSVHHVYSAWLMSKTEKNGCLDSIFTGYKFVPPNELEEHQEGGGDKK